MSSPVGKLLSKAPLEVADGCFQDHCRRPCGKTLRANPTGDHTGKGGAAVCHDERTIGVSVSGLLHFCSAEYAAEVQVE